MKNMYKFVKSITILFVMMGVLNGCEENGNSGDSEDDSGNYEYVDLGLPSGLKWATCNVGAENPEDYGDYFAWGETKTKDTYTADNNITNGLQIEDISGDSEYDAAAANWRGAHTIGKCNTFAGFGIGNCFNRPRTVNNHNLLFLSFAHTTINCLRNI